LSPTHRRRRRILALAGAAVAAALLVGLGFALAGLLRPPAAAPGPGPSGARDGGDKPRDDGPADKPKPPEPPDDPDVLTVAKSGKAQFQTITAALEAVKPGQTIRVLDAAVYPELLLLNRASQYAGVTLESPRRATLELDAEGVLIDIRDVPGVRVRGFRLRTGRRSPWSLVAVSGRCPGTECCDLECVSTVDNPDLAGVLAFRAEPGPDAKDAAVLDVHDCVFRRVGLALVVQALNLADYRTPLAVDGVRLRNNLILDAYRGVFLVGQLRRVQATGNRIVGTAKAGIYVEKLLPGAEQILIANNTLLDCREALRLWDRAAPVQGIQVRNNLFLAGPGPDFVYYDSGGKPDRERGPGDAKELHAAWRIDANWREGTPPTGATNADKGWVPPGALDTLKEKIDGVERDPARGDDFLRPEAKSLLATQGAGVVDPALPRYVGALPPKGTPAWDWDRTWLAPPPGKLLTVSKDPRDKADFDTIAAALAKATPWATVRVLDAADYPEALTLDRAQQTGLTLEAVRGATIQLPTKAPAALRIEDVPHVRVRGFRFREPAWRFDLSAAFVQVKGKSAGFVLEDADLEATNSGVGVSLQSITGGPDSAWSVVRRCRIRSTASNPNDGITVAGAAALGVCRRVRIHDNRIQGVLRGVWLSGELDQIEVAGNLVFNCTQTGLQIENLKPDSGRVLLANNTAFGCGGGDLRLFFPRREAELRPGQVALINNLWFGALEADVISLVPGDALRSAPALNDEAVLKNWRFRGNARDFGGSSGLLLPRAEDDRKLQADDLLSRDASRPDQIRPRKDSPLATQGAGAKDAAFPPYIGALPPEGTPPWDWDRSGSACAPRASGEKKDAPK
jgi:nitrous oxidase accessory protein NosD